MTVNTPKCHGAFRTLTLDKKNATMNAEILAGDLAEAQRRVDELKRIADLNAFFLPRAGP